MPKEENNIVEGDTEYFLKLYILISLKSLFSSAVTYQGVESVLFLKNYP